MFKQIILVGALMVVGCVGQISPGEDPDSSCFAETASEFLAGSVSCTPLRSAGCAFDTHNCPVELAPGTPGLSYFCVCNDHGHYACFGSPGLPAADPIGTPLSDACGYEKSEPNHTPVNTAGGDSSTPD